MSGLARSVTVTGFGDFRDLQAELERTGIIADTSTKKIVTSASGAGRAAAEQAKAMGASADEQTAAAGRAAAAFVDSSSEITKAQKAAASAAAEAAKAMGASADEQVAASRRAMEAAAESGKGIGTAFEEGTSRAGNALTKLGNTGASWGIPFAASLEKMGHQFDAAQSKGDKFTSAMSSLGKLTLVGGAVGGVAVAAEAVKLGEAYETAQAKIQTATGVDKRSAEELTHAFGATAGQFVVSGQEMETAYAGVSGQLKLTEGHALGVAEAMKFSTAANDLSEASGEGLDASYKALAGTMQAFHVEAGKAAATSDELYNVSKNLDVPISQVETATARLHSRLGDLAPSLGDIGGLMTALGSHGVQGSRGLQVVNTAFQTLVGNSKPTSEVLKALGVNVFDQQGHFIGLQSVIGQLQPKLAGLTQQQRLFAEQTLFGKGAAEIMGQVIQAGVPAFDHATHAATQLGTAHAGAERQSKTLHNEVEKLGSAAKTLGGDFGQILVPDLDKTAHALAEGIEWIVKHKAAAEALGLVITGVLGAAVAVYAEQKAVKFASATKNMIDDMGKLVQGIKTGSGAIVGHFGEQEKAAADAASEVRKQTGAASDAVATEAQKVGASAGEVDGSFAGTSAAASKAADGIGVAEGRVVSEVGAADSKVEEKNAAAAGSFSGLLGKLGGLALGAFGVYEGAKIEESLIGGHVGELLGGDQPGEKSKEGESSVNAWNKREGARQANTARNQMVVQAAKRYGVNPGVLWGIYGNETSYGTNISTSSAGAEGAFQFIPSTAKEYHYPLTNNPTAQQFREQAEAAAKYMSVLIKEHHGNVSAALEQYSGGATDYAKHALENAKSTPSGSGAIQSLMEEHSGAKEKAKKTAAALGVPAGVVTMLSTAQALIGTKYTSGGGHDGWDPIQALKQIGVDCSGFVSQVLHRGGVLSSPLTTSGLPGAPGIAAGAGKYVTVYDRPTGSQAHELIEILGHYFESGGNPKANPSGGVSLLTAAQAKTELAGGGFEAFHPTALNKAVRGGVEASALTKGLAPQEAAAAAYAKTIAGLESKAKAMLGESTPSTDLAAANQSATVPQLEKVLGASTGGSVGKRVSGALTPIAGQLSSATLEHVLMPLLGKSAASSARGKSFDDLIAELKATHSTALKGMAGQLLQAHTQALANLGRELYAVTEEKQGQAMQNAATQEKDRTQQAANFAAKQLQIAKDQATQQTDAMSAAAKQIEDSMQEVKDSLAASAEAIQDAAQAMSDQASGEVQATQDKTAIAVAELGERGKYGLELIAQKQEVQLDQMKASYDIQIQQAKMAVDQAKTQGQQLVAEKQQNVDLLQAHEDALTAVAQAHADAVQLAGDQQLAMAQGALDIAQLGTDVQVDLAAQAQIMVAGGTKAQQDAAKGWMTWAQGHQATSLSESQAALARSEAQANAAEQSAAGQLALAQGQASQAMAEAQRSLVEAEGQAKNTVAKAEQSLAAIEDTAKVAEAGLEGQVAITRAEAQTQYAGSGLVIEEMNISGTNAGAIEIANEMGWQLRTLLPA